MVVVKMIDLANGAVTSRHGPSPAVARI